MNIKQFSKKTGLSKRMLRYYEEQLLLCPVRQENGYREYNSLDLKIAHIIRTLSEYGLKIKD